MPAEIMARARHELLSDKLILIVGLSVAAVIGMFVLGKFMDKGNAEEPLKCEF